MRSGWIGRPIDRYDGVVKVRGAAKYSADVAVEGLLHAVFVTSTVASGRIRQIDTAAAEATPGVVAVFTHENLPNLAAKPRWDLVKVTGQSFAFLQDAEIQYSQQPIAVVVAKTLEQSEGAAMLVGVDYEWRTPTATLGQAFAQGQIEDVDHVMQVLPAHYVRGDVDAACAAATHVVRRDYRLSGQNGTTPSNSRRPRPAGTGTS